MSTQILFERIDDGTELRVVHTDLGSDDERATFKSHWCWHGVDGQVQEITIGCPAARAATAEARLQYELAEIAAKHGLRMVRVVQ